MCSAGNGPRKGFRETVAEMARNCRGARTWDDVVRSRKSPEQIRRSLLELFQRIDADTLPQYLVDWGFDRFRVTAVATPGRAADQEPGRCVIVTPSAASLGYLFYSTKHIFLGWIDVAARVEMCRRMADRALGYQRTLGSAPEQRRELLLVVLHEAWLVMDELEAGRFKAEVSPVPPEPRPHPGEIQRFFSSELELRKS